MSFKLCTQSQCCIRIHRRHRRMDDGIRKMRAKEVEESEMKEVQRWIKQKWWNENHANNAMWNETTETNRKLPSTRDK